MSRVAVPDHARGRIGMVALLRRMKGAADGRLVVVHEPAGYLSTMVGSARPVFCWTVHLLGLPIEVGGEPCRDLYVPDRCLIPLGAMSDEALKVVVRGHAEEDLRAALADLSVTLNATDLPPSVFARLASLAAERNGIEAALEEVPVAIALREIGFKPTHPEGEALEWASLSAGIELRFCAGPGPLEPWTIAAYGSNADRLVCDERTLPPRAPRGQIMQVVLSMWRHDGANRGPIPEGLRLGEVYERHQADLKRMETALPVLHVDAQIFRATRRWIIERHGYMDQPTVVRLNHSAGLLRLEADSAVYGCPARGIWLEPREILLSDLAALPADVLRRRWLHLEQDDDVLKFNGWALRAPVDDSPP